MKKIIFMLVVLLVTLTLYAQEKKTLGTRVATLSSYYFPVSDFSGNLLVESKNAILLIAPNGKVIKQITPNGTKGFFLPTNHKTIILYLGKDIQFYSLEKEQTKLASFKLDACSDPAVLKNGNALIALNDGSLKIYTPKGTLAYQTVLPLAKAYCNLSEYADGTIVASTTEKIYFLTSQLKLFKTIDLRCQIHLKHLGNLLVCTEYTGNIHFISSDGELKSTFKTGNKFLMSYTSLPNGLSAFMLNDGYIYFLDAEGNKKFAHFHDTEFYSTLAVVNDKVLAYWNKSEIVFLDFQGNEIGTFKMPKARTDQSKQSITTLIGLGNGTVVAMEESGQLHFIGLK